MHIFSGMNSNLDEILQCTGAFHVKEGKMFPKKYIGMFKAYNDNGILKSQPGRIPTGAQTIATFQTQAMNGGRGYGLWNYSDWCKENALHLSYFAYTNYENNVGVGRINNYNRVRNIVTGFTLPLALQKTCGYVATVDSQGAAVKSLPESVQKLPCPGVGPEMTGGSPAEGPGGIGQEGGVRGEALLLVEGPEDGQEVDLDPGVRG